MKHTEDGFKPHQGDRYRGPRHSSSSGDGHTFIIKATATCLLILSVVCAFYYKQFWGLGIPLTGLLPVNPADISGVVGMLAFGIGLAAIIVLAKFALARRRMVPTVVFLLLVLFSSGLGIRRMNEHERSKAAEVANRTSAEDEIERKRQLEQLDQRARGLRAQRVFENQQTELVRQRSEFEQSEVTRCQNLLAANKQGVFDEIHPIGEATSVKVNSIAVVWKNSASAEALSYAMKFTLYWTGPLTKDGFTQAEFKYDSEVERVTSMQVLQSNGSTKEEVAKTLVDGFLDGLERSQRQRR